MNKLAILRARLEEIENEFRSINETAGERSLDESQQSRWEELDADLTQVREDIAEEEARLEREERTIASRAKWNSLQVGATRTDPFDNLDVVHRQSDDDPAMIDRALSAVNDVSYRGLRYTASDDAKENATRMIEEVPGVARMALLTGSPSYMSAFKNYIRSMGTPVYSQEEALAVRAALTLTSANGGYALPFLLDPTLIHTGAMTKNVIRRVARVETGTQDTWHGVTTGNVTTYWKAEGSAFTEGGPTFGGVTIDAAMLTAYVIGSFEIFQDSNLLNQLPGLIGESIDYEEAAAFITGSGSSAPKGVITAVSGTAGSLVTCTTRATFTSASIVDTVAILNALPVRYEDSSTWVMNKATYRTVETQMVGTGAVKAIEMANGTELVGLPVVRSSVVTSTTTSGNIIAVLGDFSQYVIYDRIGVNVEFMPNVVDGSGLPTGQRGLIAYKRVGGDVSDLNAFRLLKA